MSHEILEHDNLVYVMRNRADVPWHGLGKPVQEDDDFETVKWESGILWKASLAPMEAQYVFCKLADGSEIKIPLKVPNQYAIVRDDIRMVLGTVGNRYDIYQNETMWDFIEEFQKLSGIKLETVGSLRNGRTTWVLAKKGEIEAVSGDPIEEYFLFRNSFDGSTPIQVMFTNIRVVCHNTLTMAINGARNIFAVRHTKSAEEQLKLVQKALGLRFKYQAAVQEAVAKMVNTPVTDAQVKDILQNRIFPMPQKISQTVDDKGEQVISLAEATERTIQARENRINTVIELLETGAGTDIKGVKGTLWGFWNGLTEFADHVKGIRVTDGTNAQEAKFVNALFGTGATFKADTYTELMKLAA